MGDRSRRVAGLGLIACLSILLSATATQAFAATQVRFLHAVPGGPEASLEVTGQGAERANAGSAAFGRWTDYASAPGGRVAVGLSAGARELARVSAELRDGGRFTVVATKGRGDSLVLRIYPDGESRGGVARVRAVHAAPEVGEVEVLLDRRSLGKLGRGEAGDYETVDPGSYELSARAARGEVLARRPSFAPSAGTAGTAYLIGSSGERTRLIYTPDGASAPKAAPATGLGGLSDDRPSWPLAALAAAVAAALGATAYLTAAARRSRGGA